MTWLKFGGLLRDRGQERGAAEAAALCQRDERLHTVEIDLHIDNRVVVAPSRHANEATPAAAPRPPPLAAGYAPRNGRAGG